MNLHHAKMAMDAHPDRGAAPFRRYCSSCHGVNAQGSFDDSDVAAVADYLSRLRGPARAHERMLSNGVVVD
jgi:cytochrome c